MAKYDKQHINLLLKYLRAGEPRTYAVLKAGIAYTTFLRWMDSKVNFANAIKEAELSGLSDIEQSARSKIKENEAWQSQAWLLERMFPDRYKLKTEQHNTQPVQIVIDKDDAKL